MAAQEGQLEKVRLLNLQLVPPRTRNTPIQAQDLFPNQA